MVLIGLGANLPSRYGSPPETLAAALTALAQSGVGILRRSSWYETAPVPVSDQPWYVNGVAIVEASLDPAALLERLHAIEVEFGRVRSVANAARAVDLDLLDYDGRVSTDGAWPVLPHPRLHERAFVLRPLAEVAPGWRHPVSRASAEELLTEVDPAQATCLLLHPDRKIPG